MIDVHIVAKEDINHKTTAYDRKFVLNGDGPFFVNTDMEQLRQLLFIILDNARKYSEKDIKTTISENEHGTTISIMDYGDGIPKKDLDRVFDRFYRVDEARNRKTGGTGLGMAIAKDISDRLSAKLTIQSTVGFGTTIHIFLPSNQILIDF